mmetsp:Transcript_9103/g.27271  ORF Transcript_9103/g.27271 Transcript_9103/m.27271 type:complete len:201 (-) Transcript_9103:1297-1899(-)
MAAAAMSMRRIPPSTMTTTTTTMTMTTITPRTIARPRTTDWRSPPSSGARPALSSLPRSEPVLPARGTAGVDRAGRGAPSSSGTCTPGTFVGAKAATATATANMATRRRRRRRRPRPNRWASTSTAPTSSASRRTRLARPCSRRVRPTGRFCCSISRDRRRRRRRRGRGRSSQSRRPCRRRRWSRPPRSGSTITASRWRP